jgi:hypothetical protein
VSFDDLLEDIGQAVIRFETGAVLQLANDQIVMGRCRDVVLGAPSMRSKVL